MLIPKSKRQPQQWGMVQVADVNSNNNSYSSAPSQAGLAGMMTPASMLQADVGPSQMQLAELKSKMYEPIDYPEATSIDYDTQDSPTPTPPTYAPRPIPAPNGKADGNTHINDIIIDGKRHNPYTKKSGNKAFRNNNPGNITGMSGKLLYGAARIAHSKYGDKGDQAQLVYDTPDKGFRAMHSLMSSDRYNNAPIHQAFAKWQSDKAAWANMLVDLNKSGINTQQRFGQLSPAHQALFMNKRARHEGWTGQDFRF